MGEALVYSFKVNTISLLFCTDAIFAIGSHHFFFFITVDLQISLDYNECYMIVMTFVIPKTFNSLMTLQKNNKYFGSMMC